MFFLCFVLLLRVILLRASLDEIGGINGRRVFFNETFLQPLEALGSCRSLDLDLATWTTTEEMDALLSMIRRWPTKPSGSLSPIYGDSDGSFVFLTTGTTSPFTSEGEGLHCLRAMNREILFVTESLCDDPFPFFCMERVPSSCPPRNVSDPFVLITSRQFCGGSDEVQSFN